MGAVDWLSGTEEGGIEKQQSDRRGSILSLVIESKCSDKDLAMITRKNAKVRVK